MLQPRPQLWLSLESNKQKTFIKSEGGLLKPKEVLIHLRTEWYPDHSWLVTIKFGSQI